MYVYMYVCICNMYLCICKYVSMCVCIHAYVYMSACCLHVNMKILCLQIYVFWYLYDNPMLYIDSNYAVVDKIGILYDQSRL